MRRFLLTLLFVCISVTGFSDVANAGVTFVQSNISDSGTTVALTGVTAGNLIVIWVKWEGASSNGNATCSDGTSSFAMATAGHRGTSAPSSQFGYLLSANGGNKTYTVTVPAGGGFIRLRVAEFSYTGGTLSFDVENIGSGSSTAPASGNVTTTGTDELVFGGYGEATVATSSSPLINGLAASTLPTQGSYTRLWYKTFASTFTGNASITLSAAGSWVCNILSFKISGGAPERNRVIISGAQPALTQGNHWPKANRGEQ